MALPRLNQFSSVMPRDPKSFVRRAFSEGEWQKLSLESGFRKAFDETATLDDAEKLIWNGLSLLDPPVSRPGSVRLKQDGLNRSFGFPGGIVSGGCP
jgi:hypothetical protein